MPRSMFKKTCSTPSVKGHPVIRLNESPVIDKFKIGICAMENKVCLFKILTFSIHLHVFRHLNRGIISESIWSDEGNSYEIGCSELFRDYCVYQ